MKDHTDSTPAPMNGGNGTLSYSRNSKYQKQSADLAKGKIEEFIATKLDVKSLCSASNTFTLVDLGCSVGPNTIIAMQDFVEAIKHKYKDQCPSNRMPEFQVFFNDQALNDFNTLFASLPQDRSYFAAGVPGSFYGRLFPESSIHLAYSSVALQWLSKVPEELRDRNSPAWNKGRIHCSNASDEVVKAYAAQFARDMENFLNARAKEIATGGMLVIIVPATMDGVPHSQSATGLLFSCMASSLMDMVKLGIINEDEVDSFNMPYYGPYPNEMKEMVERHGQFSIEEMDATIAATLLNGEPINIPEWVAHIRAAMEGVILKNFGSNLVDDIFERVTRKLIQRSDELDMTAGKTLTLLLVLKRQ